ncbi:HAMP domain-containing sensor histidine kinase [Streptomyces sp. SRF1]|uniref:sensor histidine kinase n=1 Tax=Streptomyces sp. SRF1 TaxID=1549642 RepID=UPI0025B15902|nr:HAMP domain-containing sensor histidine kinase [Streptomyces sp. SRF1]MDN3059738.1 HAMP domain-containing sensor histidine kinase [Streptomyces sp. SRF1]
MRSAPYRPVFRRLAPRTLRGRLSLVALTTAALLITALTIVFNTVMERQLRHQADDELRARATAVAATVDTSGPRVRVLEAADDQPLDTNVWIYAGQRLLERPPATTGNSPLTRTAGRIAARGTPGCATVRAAHQRPVRLCARPVPGGHATATVLTALDLTPYQGSADTLLRGSLVLGAAVLVCAYVLTRLAVGRALRPVRTMTDQATQWSAVGSDQRFGTGGEPVELARLGASLDALLDRIRAVLRHERQLTGELSHELRTPLTRIIAELDWWRSRPRSAAETRAVHEVIDDAARSMRTICDTLLRDARDNAADASAAPGTADVVPVLRRMAQRLGTPAQAPAVMETVVAAVVAAEDARLEAGVTPAFLERVVGPPLSNAVRYARSTVTVTARRVPGGVAIDITDDGPGVPQAFAGELFQPGRRADPGDGHHGAGLGLPLARRLARSVGGEVSYDAGHRPGARFTVTLPAG